LFAALTEVKAPTIEKIKPKPTISKKVAINMKIKSSIKDCL
jgi:hypothetical protein